MASSCLGWSTSAYPSHSYVVMLFIFVSWFLERKCAIVTTQVASKSYQHLWEGKEIMSQASSVKRFIFRTNSLFTQRGGGQAHIIHGGSIPRTPVDKENCRRFRPTGSVLGWRYSAKNPLVLLAWNMQESIIAIYLSQRWMDIKEKSPVNIIAPHLSKMCFIPTMKKRKNVTIH